MGADSTGRRPSRASQLIPTTGDGIPVAPWENPTDWEGSPTDREHVPHPVSRSILSRVDLDTIGKRIADIRARLGPAPARPLSQHAFVQLLAERTGFHLDRSELSRLERDARGAPLAVIDAISRLDPAQRGREWLGWGEAPDHPDIH